MTFNTSPFLSAAAVLRLRRVRSRSRFGQAISSRSGPCLSGAAPTSAQRNPTQTCRSSSSHVVHRNERPPSTRRHRKLFEDQRRVPVRVQARSATSSLPHRCRQKPSSAALLISRRPGNGCRGPRRPEAQQPVSAREFLRHVADHDLLICKHGAAFAFQPLFSRSNSQ